MNRLEALANVIADLGRTLDERDAYIAALEQQQASEVAALRAEFAQLETEADELRAAVNLSA